MKIEEACKITGFSKCKWEPTEGEECDNCDETGKQPYYRRECYEVEEGSYFCDTCVIAEAEDNLSEAALYDPIDPAPNSR